MGNLNSITQISSLINDGIRSPTNPLTPVGNCLPPCVLYRPLSMVGHEHMLERHINQSVSGSNLRKQGSREYDPHFADRETEFERLFSPLTMMMIIIALPDWLTNAQERLVLPGELPPWMVCAKTRSHRDSPKRGAWPDSRGLSRCRRWMPRGLRAPSSQCPRRAGGTGGREGTAPDPPY